MKDKRKETRSKRRKTKKEIRGERRKREYYGISLKT